MQQGTGMHEHAAAPATNPGPSQQRPPTHLIVMVNGLWGFQKDWAKMQQALHVADTCGNCLIHVSGVNTGARTYDGIDVCGARLAAEITQLTTAHPSLCSLSLLGHSMGGLIARYALGLLADPKTCKVGGLSPEHFISIAAPHLGCCSDHPEEVSWQDRPYMHWLAAAVRGGYLGGPVAAAAAAAAAAAVTPPAAAAAATAPAAGSEGLNSDLKASSSSSSSSKVWPWTPCRSVVQLLGCDAWTGPAADPSSNSSSSSEGKQQQQHGSSIASIQVRACSCCSQSKAESSTKGEQQEQQQDGGSSCKVCGDNREPSSTPLLLQPGSSSCASCGSSKLSVSSTAADQAAAAAVTMPLLDAMASDVQLCCSSCGAKHVCCFLSGLKLFKQRTTYSSAGGDHLIPWASSSLLLPCQLPTWPGQLPAAALWAAKPVIRQWPQTEAAEAAATPVIRHQPEAATAVRQQQQGSATLQQLEVELQHDMHQPAEASRSTNTTAAAAAKAVDAAAKAVDAAEGGSSSSSRSSTTEAVAATAAGPLSYRLLRLQSVGPWRHFHVVWPRLCLGSSHCNIQYNGPLNFAGKAVVDHVVASLMQPGPA